MKNIKSLALVLAIAFILTAVFNFVSVSNAISEEAKAADFKTSHVTTVSKDLGVECGYCHKMDAMNAATPMKDATKDMVELTNKLRDDKGKPITCGFCHNGKAKYLKVVKPENAK